MTYDGRNVEGLLERLRPSAHPRPGFMWPENWQEVAASEALYGRLQTELGDEVLPLLGSWLPGSTEFRGEKRSPVLMVDPAAFVIAEYMGPFEDKSVLNSLKVRFYFGDTDSLTVLCENGRERLIRYVWILDFAESGYEGHAHMYRNFNTDRFASILAQAIA